MRLGAIQVFQPQGTALTLRGTAARLGRLAVLYMAVASIGATLALFSFLLTWRNLSLALAGLVVGLALVHRSTIFIEVLIFLIRHFKRDLRSLSTTWFLLSHELRSIWVARDLNGAVGAELRLLVRSVAILLIGAMFFALAHESLTLRWSSLTGFYIGAALVVIGRFIFHVHRLGIHHYDDTDATPDASVDRSHKYWGRTMIEERVVAAAILGELIPELQYAAPVLLKRLDRGEPMVNRTSPSDLGFENGIIDAQMLELFRHLAPCVSAALGYGMFGILQSWVLRGRSKKSQDELLTALSQLRAQNTELRQVLESIARELSVAGHAPVPQSEIDEAIAAAVARLAQNEL